MMDIMACIIDGGIRQEKFYIMTGSGSNGKSKWLELIQKAIGDYFCILPIALLTQKRAASNSAQSELERTKGRRFAVMQEPGESERLNIGLMKELSGGDRIMCRGLFKEPIEFKPQFKMAMTCNELPEVPSDDGGTWRRIRVIEHTSKFVEHPDPANPKEFLMDVEITEKFDRWADTFISMLISHHAAVDPKNISEPDSVKTSTNRYKQNNDLLGQFVSEKMVSDDTSADRVTIAKVYNDFRMWVQGSGVKKDKKLPDRNQFRAYVEKQFGVYPSDGKGWRGIRYSLAESSGADNDDVE
jgi:P4 family phage/plasmid primase-like protien